MPRAPSSAGDTRSPRRPIACRWSTCTKATSAPCRSCRGSSASPSRSAIVRSTHCPRLPARATSRLTTFRAAVESERTADAQALVLAAIERGDTADELRRWFTAVVSDHLLSYGHGAIYAQKAFELLAMIGWERAATVLPHLVPTLVYGTREDKLPYMRPFVRGLESLDLAIARRRADRGRLDGRRHAALDVARPRPASGARRDGRRVARRRRHRRCPRHGRARGERSHAAVRHRRRVRLRRRLRLARHHARAHVRERRALAPRPGDVTRRRNHARPRPARVVHRVPRPVDRPPRMAHRGWGRSTRSSHWPSTSSTTAAACSAPRCSTAPRRSSSTPTP